MTSKPILVKLKKEGVLYEVLTHHGMVEPFREGRIGWSKVPYVDGVFKNSQAGTKFTDSQLQSSFGTSDINEVMKTIVMHGELQLTITDRKRKLDELKRQILNEIHKYYLDPRTMKSHPITTIEAAIEKTKIRLTLDQPMEKQLDAIVKKLPEHIPVRKIVMTGILCIPNIYIGKANSVIAKYATEEGNRKYDEMGCIVSVSIVPGYYDKLMADLNSITKGETIFEVDSLDGSSSSSEIQSSSTQKTKKELKNQKKKDNRKKIKDF